MIRARERIEGRIDADQMDFLYLRSWKEVKSRNQVLREALDRDPEYKAIMEEVQQGTDKGKQYLKEAAVARRTLTSK